MNSVSYRFDHLDSFWTVQWIVFSDVVEIFTTDQEV